jgi:adenylate kinase
MAAAGAVMTGAYLTILKNHDGQVQETAQELVKVLRS